MLYLVERTPGSNFAALLFDLTDRLSDRGEPVCPIDTTGSSEADDRVALVRSLLAVFRDAGERHFLVPIEPDEDVERLAFWYRVGAREACYRLRPEPALVGREYHRDLELLESNPESLRVTPWRPDSPPLETARLRLAWPTPTQIAQYYDDITGSTMFDTIIWDGPSSAEELETSHLRFQQQYLGAASPAGRTLSVGVIEKETDLLVGGVAWRPKIADPATGDIGYAFAPRFHGRGFATEAVRELVRHAFEEGEARRIEAQVFVGNIASRRVLEKNGFEFEGTLAQAILKRGQRVDEWLFSLTRDRWG